MTRWRQVSAVEQLREADTYAHVVVNGDGTVRIVDRVLELRTLGWTTGRAGFQEMKNSRSRPVYVRRDRTDDYYDVDD
jgi:hypothetical protein